MPCVNQLRLHTHKDDYIQLHLHTHFTQVSAVSRLQSVQNAAAHLITGVRQCEHTMPALRQQQCTGCQSADERISSYLPSSIVRWLALLMCT